MFSNTKGRLVGGLSAFVLAASVVGISAVGGSSADASVTNAQATCTVAGVRTVCYPLDRNSVAEGQVVNNSLTGSDVKDGSLTGTDVADGSLNSNDLSSPLYNLLLAVPNNGVTTGKMADGAATEPKLGTDVQAKLNDQRQQVYVDAISAPVVIDKIGGPITTNGTNLDAVDLVLPAGTYIVQVSGQIDRTTAAATPDKATQPQLSLWLDKDNDGVFEWQTGEGSISPNGTIPDTKDRSVTVNGEVVVTLAAPTHVKLLAFGYNADTSAAGGGELTVGAAMVSATPIK